MGQEQGRVRWVWEECTNPSAGIDYIVTGMGQSKSGIAKVGKGHDRMEQAVTEQTGI